MSQNIWEKKAVAYISSSKTGDYKLRLVIKY